MFASYQHGDFTLFLTRVSNAANRKEMAHNIYIVMNRSSVRAHFWSFYVLVGSHVSDSKGNVGNRTRQQSFTLTTVRSQGHPVGGKEDDCQTLICLWQHSEKQDLTTLWGS